ncbi:keratin-associated protein 13-1-like [Myotis lucifugus]|uniref:keratin-associated protein 13-1-like n=1 Tax=Myotis lucifugus TaxID=59463 RepID=UPI000CCBF555|nr:keratin-associated protein 13-1-like [Myotis lucifugus]
MSYSLSSRTLSSRSLGGRLRYPASSCGSFYPGNTCSGNVYPGNTCSGNFYPGNTCSGNFYPGNTCSGNIYSGNVAYTQGTCQQDSPSHGCQETCWEPAGYQAPSYGRRSSSLRRSYQATCPGSLGCGSTGLGPFGYGGSQAQSPGCGAGYCRPTYFSSSRTYQGPSFQPACGSGCYGQTY